MQKLIVFFIELKYANSYMAFRQISEMVDFDTFFPTQFSWQLKVFNDPKFKLEFAIEILKCPQNSHSIFSVLLKTPIVCYKL